MLFFIYIMNIIYYLNSRGVVVGRKGESHNVAGWDHIVFYQNKNGRNRYSIGVKKNTTVAGTDYEKLTIFMNGQGQNQAVIGETGIYTIYQNGNFRNLCALGRSYYNGGLQEISESRFSNLFDDFLSLL